MKMNLPNKLTILRVLLIPVCMFFIIYRVLGDVWSPIVAAAVFMLTSFTDMLDGKIARKYGLITDFGKFLDPLADKMLIFGCLVSLMFTVSRPVAFTHVLLWGGFVIILRELSVTSLRLVVSGNANIVVAAGMLGKIKTVSQMVSIVTVILEPVIMKLINTGYVLSYVTFGFAVIMTVWSGIDYFVAYWPYLDSNK